MATIDVDFEVFKALTIRRATEEDSYNDVIRELLGLDTSVQVPTTAGIRGAVFKGVTFPDGTAFKATHKGAPYTAVIRNGKWVDTSTGEIRSSPSHAATKITGTTVNGWRFWSCQRPGDTGWILLDKLQKASISFP